MVWAVRLARLMLGHNTGNNSTAGGAGVANHHPARTAQRSRLTDRCKKSAPTQSVIAEIGTKRSNQTIYRPGAADALLQQGGPGGEETQRISIHGSVSVCVPNTV